jgi:hypothetical protein
VHWIAKSPTPKSRRRQHSRQRVACVRPPVYDTNSRSVGIHGRFSDGVMTLTPSKSAIDTCDLLSSMISRLPTENRERDRDFPLRGLFVSGSAFGCISTGVPANCPMPANHVWTGGGPFIPTRPIWRSIITRCSAKFSDCSCSALSFACDALGRFGQQLRNYIL